MSKQLSHWLSVIVIGIALGLGLQFVRAWTEPTQAPPGGNVGAPINTSGNYQAKSGRLDIQGGSAMPKMWDSDNANYVIDPAGNSMVDTICFYDGCRNNWGTTYTNCFWSDNQCSPYSGYFAVGVYVNMLFSDIVGGHYVVQCCRL